MTQWVKTKPKKRTMRWWRSSNRRTLERKRVEREAKKERREKNKAARKARKASK